MHHAGIQYGQGSMPSNSVQYNNVPELSVPSSTPSTTAALRQWRKKESTAVGPVEKPALGQDQAAASAAASESQGPIARVAPQAHYPRPTEPYRYPHQYPPAADYGLNCKDLSPTPVKYSEIVEPAHPSRLDHHLSPIIQKAKEKDYLDMCSVQHPQMNNMKHAYQNIHPAMIPPPHPPQYKESHMHHPSAAAFTPYPIPNYKMNQYQRQYGNEGGFHPLPLFNEQQFYSMDQRAYQNHHPQRMYRSQVAPPGSYRTPVQGYSNAMQGYNYKSNMQTHHDPYNRMIPHTVQKYPDYKHLEGARRMYPPENLPSYPAPRVSPNYPQCNQMEYAQHYQNRRHQEYLQQQHELKIPYVQGHMPDIVTENTPKSSLKQYLETWNDDIPDIQDGKSEASRSKESSSLYILDSTEIPTENVQQFLHLQVDKLPENIKFLTAEADSVIKPQPEDPAEPLKFINKENSALNLTESSSKNSIIPIVETALNLTENIKYPTEGLENKTSDDIKLESALNLTQDTTTVIRNTSPKISVISETKKFLENETQKPDNPEKNNTVIVYNDKKELHMPHLDKPVDHLGVIDELVKSSADDTFLPSDTELPDIPFVGEGVIFDEDGTNKNIDERENLKRKHSKEERKDDTSQVVDNAGIGESFKHKHQKTSNPYKEENPHSISDVLKNKEKVKEIGGECKFDETNIFKSNEECNKEKHKQLEQENSTFHQEEKCNDERINKSENICSEQITAETRECEESTKNDKLNFNESIKDETDSKRINVIEDFTFQKVGEEEKLKVVTAKAIDLHVNDNKSFDVIEKDNLNFEENKNDTVHTINTISKDINDEKQKPKDCAFQNESEKDLMNSATDGFLQNNENKIIKEENLKFENEKVCDLQNEGEEETGHNFKEDNHAKQKTKEETPKQLLNEDERSCNKIIVVDESIQPKDDKNSILNVDKSKTTINYIPSRDEIDYTCKEESVLSIPEELHKINQDKEEIRTYNEEIHNNNEESILQKQLQSDKCVVTNNQEVSDCVPQSERLNMECEATSSCNYEEKKNEEPVVKNIQNDDEICKKTIEIVKGVNTILKDGKDCVFKKEESEGNSNKVSTEMIKNEDVQKTTNIKRLKIEENLDEGRIQNIGVVQNENCIRKEERIEDVQQLKSARFLGEDDLEKEQKEEGDNKRFPDDEVFHELNREDLKNGKFSETEICQENTDEKLDKLIRDESKFFQEEETKVQNKIFNKRTFRSKSVDVNLLCKDKLFVGEESTNSYRNNDKTYKEEKGLQHGWEESANSYRNNEKTYKEEGLKHGQTTTISTSFANNKMQDENIQTSSNLKIEDNSKNVINEETEISVNSSPLVIEGSHILLQIGGEILEINVAAMSGRKKISVIPRSNCTVCTKHIDEEHKRNEESAKSYNTIEDISVIKNNNNEEEAKITNNSSSTTIEEKDSSSELKDVLFDSLNKPPCFSKQNEDSLIEMEDCQNKNVFPEEHRDSLSEIEVSHDKNLLGEEKRCDLSVIEENPIIEESEETQIKNTITESNENITENLIQNKETPLNNKNEEKEESMEQNENFDLEFENQNKETTQEIEERNDHHDIQNDCRVDDEMITSMNQKVLPRNKDEIQKEEDNNSENHHSEESSVKVLQYNTVENNEETKEEFHLKDVINFCASKINEEKSKENQCEKIIPDYILNEPNEEMGMIEESQCKEVISQEILDLQMSSNSKHLKQNEEDFTGDNIPSKELKIGEEDNKYEDQRLEEMKDSFKIIKNNQMPQNTHQITSDQNEETSQNHVEDNESFRQEIEDSIKVSSNNDNRNTQNEEVYVLGNEEVGSFRINPNFKPKIHESENNSSHYNGENVNDKSEENNINCNEFVYKKSHNIQFAESKHEEIINPECSRNKETYIFEENKEESNILSEDIEENCRNVSLDEASTSNKKKSKRRLKKEGRRNALSIKNSKDVTKINTDIVGINNLFEANAFEEVKENKRTNEVTVITKTRPNEDSTTFPMQQLLVPKINEDEESDLDDAKEDINSIYNHCTTSEENSKVLIQNKKQIEENEDMHMIYYGSKAFATENEEKKKVHNFSENEENKKVHHIFSENEEEKRVHNNYSENEEYYKNIPKLKKTQSKLLETEGKTLKKLYVATSPKDTEEPLKLKIRMNSEEEKPKRKYNKKPPENEESSSGEDIEIIHTEENKIRFLRRHSSKRRSKSDEETVKSNEATCKRRKSNQDYTTVNNASYSIETNNEESYPEMGEDLRVEKKKRGKDGRRVSPLKIRIKRTRYNDERDDESEDHGESVWKIANESLKNADVTKSNEENKLSPLKYNFHKFDSKKQTFTVSNIYTSKCNIESDDSNECCIDYSSTKLNEDCVKNEIKNSEGKINYNFEERCYFNHYKTTEDNTIFKDSKDNMLKCEDFKISNNKFESVNFKDRKDCKFEEEDIHAKKLQNLNNRGECCQGISIKETPKKVRFKEFPESDDEEMNATNVKIVGNEESVIKMRSETSQNQFKNFEKTVEKSNINSQEDEKNRLKTIEDNQIEVIVSSNTRRNEERSIISCSEKLYKRKCGTGSSKIEEIIQRIEERRNEECDEKSKIKDKNASMEENRLIRNEDECKKVEENKSITKKEMIVNEDKGSTKKCEETCKINECANIKSMYTRGDVIVAMKKPENFQSKIFPSPHEETNHSIEEILKKETHTVKSVICNNILSSKYKEEMAMNTSNQEESVLKKENEEIRSQYFSKDDKIEEKNACVIKNEASVKKIEEFHENPHQYIKEANVSCLGQDETIEESHTFSSNEDKIIENEEIKYDECFNKKIKSKDNLNHLNEVGIVEDKDVHDSSKKQIVVGLSEDSQNIISDTNIEDKNVNLNYVNEVCTHQDNERRNVKLTDSEDCDQIDAYNEEKSLTKCQHDVVLEENISYDQDEEDQDGIKRRRENPNEENIEEKLLCEKIEENHFQNDDNINEGSKNDNDEIKESSSDLNKIFPKEHIEHSSTKNDEVEENNIKSSQLYKNLNNEEQNESILTKHLNEEMQFDKECNDYAEVESKTNLKKNEETEKSIEENEFKNNEENEKFPLNYTEDTEVIKTIENNEEMIINSKKEIVFENPTIKESIVINSDEDINKKLLTVEHVAEEIEGISVIPVNDEIIEATILSEEIEAIHSEEIINSGDEIYEILVDNEDIDEKNKEIEDPLLINEVVDEIIINYDEEIEETVENNNPEEEIVNSDDENIYHLEQTKRPLELPFEENARTFPAELEETYPKEETLIGCLLSGEEIVIDNLDHAMVNEIEICERSEESKEEIPLLNEETSSSSSSSSASSEEMTFIIDDDGFDELKIFQKKLIIQLTPEDETEMAAYMKKQADAQKRRTSRLQSYKDYMKNNGKKKLNKRRIRFKNLTGDDEECVDDKKIEEKVTSESNFVTTRKLRNERKKTDKAETIEEIADAVNEETCRRLNEEKRKAACDKLEDSMTKLFMDCDSTQTEHSVNEISLRKSPVSSKITKNPSGVNKIILKKEKNVYLLSKSDEGKPSAVINSDDVESSISRKEEIRDNQERKHRSRIEKRRKSSLKNEEVETPNIKNVISDETKNTSKKKEKSRRKMLKHKQGDEKKVNSTEHEIKTRLKNEDGKYTVLRNDDMNIKILKNEKDLKNEYIKKLKSRNRSSNENIKIKLTKSDLLVANSSNQNIIDEEAKKLNARKPYQSIPKPQIETETNDESLKIKLKIQDFKEKKNTSTDSENNFKVIETKNVENKELRLDNEEIAPLSISSLSNQDEEVLQRNANVSLDVGVKKEENQDFIKDHRLIKPSRRLSARKSSDDHRDEKKKEGVDLVIRKKEDQSDILKEAESEKQVTYQQTVERKDGIKIKLKKIDVNSKSISEEIVDNTVIKYCSTLKTEQDDSFVEVDLKKQENKIMKRNKPDKSVDSDKNITNEDFSNLKLNKINSDINNEENNVLSTVKPNTEVNNKLENEEMGQNENEKSIIESNSNEKNVELKKENAVINKDDLCVDEENKIPLSEDKKKVEVFSSKHNFSIITRKKKDPPKIRTPSARNKKFFNLEDKEESKTPIENATIDKPKALKVKTKAELKIVTKPHSPPIKSILKKTPTPEKKKRLSLEEYNNRKRSCSSESEKSVKCEESPRKQQKSVDEGAIEEIVNYTFSSSGGCVKTVRGADPRLKNRKEETPKTPVLQTFFDDEEEEILDFEEESSSFWPEINNSRSSSSKSPLVKHTKNEDEETPEKLLQIETPKEIEKTEFENIKDEIIKENIISEYHSEITKNEDNNIENLENTKNEDNNIENLENTKMNENLVVNEEKKIEDYAPNKSSGIEEIAKKIDDIFTLTFKNEEELVVKFLNGDTLRPDEMNKAKNAIEKKRFAALKRKNIIDPNDFNLDLGITKIDRPKPKEMIIDLDELLPNNNSKKSKLDHSRKSCDQEEPEENFDDSLSFEAEELFDESKIHEEDVVERYRNERKCQIFENENINMKNNKRQKIRTAEINESSKHFEYRTSFDLDDLIPSIQNRKYSKNRNERSSLRKYGDKRIRIRKKILTSDDEIEERSRIFENKLSFDIEELIPKLDAQRNSRKINIDEDGSKHLLFDTEDKTTDLRELLIKNKMMRRLKSMDVEEGEIRDDSPNLECHVNEEYFEDEDASISFNKRFEKHQGKYKNSFLLYEDEVDVEDEITNYVGFSRKQLKKNDENYCGSSHEFKNFSPNTRNYRNRRKYNDDRNIRKYKHSLSLDVNEVEEEEENFVDINNGVAFKKKDDEMFSLIDRNVDDTISCKIIESNEEIEERCKNFEVVGNNPATTGTEERSSKVAVDTRSGTFATRYDSRKDVKFLKCLSSARMFLNEDRVSYTKCFLQITKKRTKTIL